MRPFTNFSIVEDIRSTERLSRLLTLRPLRFEPESRYQPWYRERIRESRRARFFGRIARPTELPRRSPHFTRSGRQSGSEHHFGPRIASALKPFPGIAANAPSLIRYACSAGVGAASWATSQSPERKTRNAPNRPRSVRSTFVPL